MKLYRGTLLRISECLQHIIVEGEYADKVVQNLFKNNRNMGSTDRKIVAESVYEIVRWKRRYARILSKDYEHLGTEDFPALVKIWLVLNQYVVPDMAELKYPDSKTIIAGWEDTKLERAVFHSIPDWMYATGLAELGADIWEKEMAWQNKPASVILRSNTLMNDAGQLKNILEKENIPTHFITGYPDALLLLGRPNVFVTRAYKEGRFEVQDASSQLVAPFLEVAPGMKVIDACAGAGGKTLHLAALMQNKGRLIAMDIHAHKLEKLKMRAKRNHVHNLECKVIDSNKVIKRLKATADRVLVDAPCSGLGVIRRNPDDKWKLSPEKLVELKATQQNILQHYAQMVKPGGKLVYATCSVLPSENQKQIEIFLNSEAGKNFVKEDEKIILASESGFDGFYMGKLKFNPESFRESVKV